MQKKKRSSHGYKVIKRFDQDIWNILVLKKIYSYKSELNSSGQKLNTYKFIKNGKKIIDFIYLVYQNNFFYKRLLKFHNNKFFRYYKKNRFLYKIVTQEKEFIRKKKTFKSKHYLQTLKLRRFYGNLKKRKFKKLLSHPIVNNSFFGKSYIYLLETRLDLLIYRSNFFHSIFAAKQFILHHGIYVNGGLIFRPNYRIGLSDVIFIKNVEKYYIEIHQKLKVNMLFSNYPSYLEVNYKLGMLILFKHPNPIEVPFPFPINYKNVGYSFIN